MRKHQPSGALLTGSSSENKINVSINTLLHDGCAKQEGASKQCISLPVTIPFINYQHSCCKKDNSWHASSWLILLFFNKNKFLKERM